MIIRRHKSFDKAMKKLSRSQKIKVIDVLKDFENNPFQRRLNNHALYGAWQ